MTYRILSLDGGGTWAAIQVQALMQLYTPATTGHQVLGDFDLAVANSGGAIVLGALVENLSLSAIFDKFNVEADRRSIFQPTTQIWGLISNLINFGPKYSTTAKLPALAAILPNAGGQALSQAISGVKSQGSAADVHLLVTAFDFDRNVAAFFRSAPTALGWGVGAASTVTLAQAVHASSTPPVNYFDQPAAFTGSRYWDGAISGCNNPVLAGVAEALTLDIAPADIRVLSLGTGTRRLPGPPTQQPQSPLQEPTSPQGFPIDIEKLATSILDDPPDIATFLAHAMTGGRNGVPARPAGAAVTPDSRIVRMSPMISPVRDAANTKWVPPGTWTAEQFDYLANDIHLDALDQGDVDYITAFGSWWIADEVTNQPVRMHTDSLAPEIGYSKFSHAALAWSIIR